MKDNRIICEKYLGDETSRCDCCKCLECDKNPETLLQNVGVTRIIRGGELYQQYLRSKDKMKFILSLEIEDFAAMQMHGKIREEINKTTV